MQLKKYSTSFFFDKPHSFAFIEMSQPTFDLLVKIGQEARYSGVNLSNDEHMLGNIKTTILVYLRDVHLVNPLPTPAHLILRSNMTKEVITQAELNQKSLIDICQDGVIEIERGIMTLSFLSESTFLRSQRFNLFDILNLNTPNL